MKKKKEKTVRTIKLPIQNPSKSFLEKIFLLQRKYSCLVRTAYNRVGEGFSNKQIRQSFKEMNNVQDLGCVFKESALKQAKSIIESKNRLESDSIVLFGGKYSFKQRARKMISKEQYKERRMFSISSVGEAQYEGNRYFSLDIISNNRIIFKPRASEKYFLSLPKLRKNMKDSLYSLERLANEKNIPITYSLNKGFIFISYDEAFLKKETTNYPKNNRILGIDLNPDNIGISILEFEKDSSFKILATDLFEFKALLKKSNKESSNKLSKYLHNKLEFETYQICKKIIAFAKSFNCSSIVVEDLNIKNKNLKKGKHINRKNNNQWLRSKVVSNLKKRAILENIEIIEVNPAYSSFIGNLQYDSVDSINASIEIARRAFLKYNKDSFYPEFSVKQTFPQSILHLWKETGIGQLSKKLAWKEAYGYFTKNPKLKYRVTLEEARPPTSVFSLNSIKSRVVLYSF